MNRGYRKRTEVSISGQFEEMADLLCDAMRSVDVLPGVRQILDDDYRWTESSRRLPGCGDRSSCKVVLIHECVL